MQLTLLFEDVDRIRPINVSAAGSLNRVILKAKTSEADRKLEILSSQDIKTAAAKGQKCHKSYPKKEHGAKQKGVQDGITERQQDGITEKQQEGITERIMKIIEELADAENHDGLVEAHIKRSIKDHYTEIFHMQQYQHQLDLYKRFLAAYLKEYKHQEADNDVKMPEYTDPFEKGVMVPKRKFGNSQEVMTHAEIRDIVRRRRMNWALGAEHNYVSPDEKERYKFWKICNKFNYVMAECCWFSL